MLENQPRTQKRDKFNLPVGQFNPATIKSVSKMEISQSLKNEVETRGSPSRFKVQCLSSPVLHEVERERVSGNHAVTKKAGSCISMLVETSWLIN